MSVSERSPLTRRGASGVSPRPQQPERSLLMMADATVRTSAGEVSSGTTSSTAFRAFAFRRPPTYCGGDCSAASPCGRLRCRFDLSRGERVVSCPRGTCWPRFRRFSGTSSSSDSSGVRTAASSPSSSPNRESGSEFRPEPASSSEPAGSLTSGSSCGPDAPNWPPLVGRRGMVRPWTWTFFSEDPPGTQKSSAYHLKRF